MEGKNKRKAGKVVKGRRTDHRGGAGTAARVGPQKLLRSEYFQGCAPACNRLFGRERSSQICPAAGCASVWPRKQSTALPHVRFRESSDSGLLRRWRAGEGIAGRTLLVH